MPGDLRGFDIFKLGDYSHLNRYKFGEKEYEQINESFFSSRAKGRKGIDIIVSQNQNDPHDLTQAVKLGKITDIYLTQGGIIKGNGYYYTDSDKADVMRNLSGKSAGMRKNDGKWLLHHVAVTSADRAIIKNLKPNAESMFSDQIDEEYIYIETKIKDKEKNMTAEINFSEAQVELKINKALEKQKADLKADFAKVEQSKDGIIAQKDETIAGLQAANDTMKATIAEFAKKETAATIAGYNERVDAIKGIKAEQKENLKTTVANFATSAVEGWQGHLETILKGYEDLPPLVQEGEQEGKRDNADFAGDGSHEVVVPSFWEAKEMREKGGK